LSDDAVASSADAPFGLLASARHVLGALVEIGQTRLQLARTELEEERLRLAQLLLYAAAAAFFLGLGIVFATLLLVVVFWDGPRVLVLSVVVLSYLGIGASLALVWRHKARSKPPLLAATIAELRRDRDALLGGPAQLP
jgi:uncharacterized membrane protein YqjE